MGPTAVANSPDEPLGARPVGHLPPRRRGGAERQGCEDIGKFRLQGCPVGRLGRDVRKESGAIDQGLADALQRGDDAASIVIDLIGKLAQEDQVAKAANHIVGPAGFAVAGAQAQVDIARPRRHQVRFERGLLFQHELPEALSVVEARPGQDIAQDRHQLVDLRGQRLAAQHEP
jgi:hypothetical protein